MNRSNPSACASAPPREIVVEVRDLVAHYRERRILDGVNLTIYQGEILVIMGASGSGKSTLLRHLLGLRRPTSGQIRMLGHDLAVIGKKDLHRLRKQIGVAFQGGALLGSLSLIE